MKKFEKIVELKDTNFVSKIEDLSESYELVIEDIINKFAIELLHEGRILDVDRDFTTVTVEREGNDMIITFERVKFNPYLKKMRIENIFPLSDWNGDGIYF